jgi:hypothetical protein
MLVMPNPRLGHMRGFHEDFNYCLFFPDSDDDIKYLFTVVKRKKWKLPEPTCPEEIEIQRDSKPLITKIPLNYEFILDLAICDADLDLIEKTPSYISKTITRVLGTCSEKSTTDLGPFWAITQGHLPSKWFCFKR